MNATYQFRVGILTIGLGVGYGHGSAPGNAQEPVRRVSLEEAVSLFHENSLELRLARADREERIGDARQSRAYFNPTIAVWHEALDAEADDYDETLLSLRQTLEWPGRTTARSRRAARQIESAGERFQADSIRLLFEVRRAFLESALAEEEASSLVEAAGLLRDIVAGAEERARDGDLSGYDLRRLRLEATRYEGSLALAELALQASRQTLTRRLFPELESELLAPDSLPGDAPPHVPADAAQSAILTRPDISAATLEVEAELAAARAASLGWIPNLTLSGGYKDQSDGFTGPAIGAAVSLPLFDRQAGRTGAAEARHQAAIARLSLTRRVAKSDLSTSHARYTSVADRADRFGGLLLGDADLLFSAARVSYAEGEMTLLELLDAVTASRDARLTALRLRAEAWTAYFDLLRAMGGEFLRGSEGEIR